MQTQRITHRALLERLLPAWNLPPELRSRIREALDADDARSLESALQAALHALEGRGLVRPVPARHDELRRYLDLSTGGIITLKPDAPRAGEIVAVPALAGGAPSSMETTRELIGLATRILSEDGDRVAETEQIVRLLTSYGREVLGCDEVRFLAVEHSAEAGVETLAGSDSPFVDLAATTWGRQRNQVYVVRDLKAAGPGRGYKQYRSAAAVRLGLPGDDVQGILEAWSARPRHFSARRLALLELLAETGRELLNNTSRLQKLVFIDSRTQIFNKSFFDIQVEHFLARARREGRQMAVAIADIDDFKKFNSNFGYKGGDQVLFRVAQILRGHIRPFDCVARWGGEEFAVLLAPPVEEEPAWRICDRLRIAVRQTAFLISDLSGKEHRTGVTISIGGSLYPSDGQTADELWQRANEALLEAKAGGKNLVRFRERESDRRDRRAAPQRGR